MASVVLKILARRECKRENRKKKDLWKHQQPPLNLIPRIRDQEFPSALSSLIGKQQQWTSEQRE
jgi:hypothetical protein